MGTHWGSPGRHSPRLHLIFLLVRLSLKPALPQETFKTDPLACEALSPLTSLPALMTSISRFSSVKGWQSLSASRLAPRR